MQNSVYIYVYVQRVDSLLSEAAYPFLGLGYCGNEEEHVLSV